MVALHRVQRSSHNFRRLSPAHVSADQPDNSAVKMILGDNRHPPLVCMDREQSLDSQLAQEKCADGLDVSLT